SVEGSRLGAQARRHARSAQGRIHGAPEGNSLQQFHPDRREDAEAEAVLVMDEMLIFEEFDAVAEMTDANSIVPLSPEIVSRVTAGDDDPRFATFIIESGWSKSKRYWGPEVFGDVASGRNAPAGGRPS